MTPAEFEEKDFEGPLYNQLLFGHHHIATPGQVFEGKYGIDAALHALHPRFWNFFGYPNAPHGCILNDFNWGWVWRRLHRKRPLPNFSTNLLIQSKRPSVILKAGAQTASHGPTGPLWQFEMRQHQQPILERVSATLGHRALVVYSSPAFDSFTALYDHTSNLTLVDNCTYVKVARLKGHDSWVYSKPGTQGVAHSEPENIEDIPFKTMLSQLSEFHTTNSDATKDLNILSSSIEQVCQELSQKSVLAQYALRVAGSLSEQRASIKEKSPYIYDFWIMSLMLHVIGITWMVVGK